MPLFAKRHCILYEIDRGTDNFIYSVKLFFAKKYLLLTYVKHFSFVVFKNISLKKLMNVITAFFWE